MSTFYELDNENVLDGAMSAAPVIEEVYEEVYEEHKIDPLESKSSDAKFKDSNTQTIVYNTKALDRSATTYKLETFEKNYLLIFNQVNVDGFRPRVGTEKDVEALQKTFSRFGFDIDVHNDLTKDSIMEELKIFSETDFTDYGCVAVVVLTHGTHGGVLRAKDMQYNETDIIKHFKTEKNPTLVTKPKLLIIQACRGTNTMKAALAKAAMMVHRDVDDKDEAYTLPLESDILVLHSSYPGKPSHRVNLFGSWYIQTLCAEINRSYHKLDIESILTNVKRKVAIDMSDVVYNQGTDEWDINKQMPVLMSTLIRKLYFRKYGENSYLDSETETQIDMPIFPTLMRAEPCRCYLPHFDYLKNCLRYVVDDNPEDLTAQSFLEICETFHDGDQFNNAKEKMTRLISSHLSVTAQNFEYFKYLYIHSIPSTPVDEVCE